MYKKTTTTVTLLITILLLFCSMELVYARKKPRVKGNEGEHKGWSEGKRTGKTEKKGKGGEGKHKGWTEGKRTGQKSETPSGQKKIFKRGRRKRPIKGWEKGLKKGWRKSKPQGWDKWDKITKKEWEKNLIKARREINIGTKNKGWNAEEQEKISIALEYSTRRGVPLGHARKVVEECINHGLTGEETLNISMTLSEGVDRGANFETLGSQVVERLRAGRRGRELADEINVMIETRYKAKMKAQGEKVGKPVGRENPKPEKKEDKLRKVKKERFKMKDIEKPGRGGKRKPEGRGAGGKGRGGRGK